MNQNKENKNIETKIDENSAPLKSITIGTLAQPKSRMTTLIMFTVISIFIAFVFFLPEIDSLIGNKPPVEGDPTSSSTFVIPDNNQEMIEISQTSKINIGNHTFTDFKINLENGSFEYQVTNFNEKRTSLDSYKWYISIFDTNKNLLDYRLLSSPLLRYAEPFSLSVEIRKSYLSEPKYVKIGAIEEKDYPEVTLNKDELDQEYLKCVKEDTEFNYYFDQKKLVKINEKYNTTQEKQGFNYDIIYESYKTKNNNYQLVEEFDSKFSDHFGSFTFEVEIKLSENNYSDYNQNYFLKNTEAKTVKFLIESRGYQCQ